MDKHLLVEWCIYLEAAFGEKVLMNQYFLDGQKVRRRVGCKAAKTPSVDSSVGSLKFDMDPKLWGLQTWKHFAISQGNTRQLWVAMRARGFPPCLGCLAMVGVVLDKKPGNPALEGDTWRRWMSSDGQFIANESAVFVPMLLRSTW